jgi:hypothetical protein
MFLKRKKNWYIVVIYRKMQIENYGFFLFKLETNMKMASGLETFTEKYVK